MITLKGKPVYSELRELVEPDHTSLVIVDLCNEPTHNEGYFHRKGAKLDAVAEVVEPIAHLREKARQAGVLVVHAVQATLPDGRGDSPAWLRMKHLAYKLTEDDGVNDDYCIEGTWGAEVHERLTPREGEPVVKKHHASAFSGTDLDMLLRANGVETVVVVGTSTYGCLLHTVMDASSMDYYTVVGRDVTAGPNAKLHEAALAVMSARYDMADANELEQIWTIPAERKENNTFKG